MLPRKRCRVSKSTLAMSAQRDEALFRDTVETLGDEIGRIVDERQRLRADGADARRSSGTGAVSPTAQSRLSQLLIERYLPETRRRLTPVRVR